MRKLISYMIVLVACSYLHACGGNGPMYNSTVPTQMPPYIDNVAPASGSPGDVITIFGFGYSAQAPSNVISFGSFSASATAYTLIPNATSNEIESLTVTIPAAATPGVVPVYVTVFGNTSNANNTFTITP